MFNIIESDPTARKQKVNLAQIVGNGLTGVPLSTGNHIPTHILSLGNKPPRITGLALIWQVRGSNLATADKWINNS